MNGPYESRRRGEALVVVSPWPYHPTCGIGGGVLCFQLLNRLAKTFDIHFVSFDQVPNDTEAGRDALARACASVTVLPAPKAARGILDLLLQSVQVLTRRPREARGMWSPDMAAAVARLVREHAPVAVLLQFPPMAQYAAAAAAAGASVVVDVQDACMVSRYREWRSAGAPLRRAARFVAWLAWFRYELRWYARADALIALSENDLGVLRSFVPEVPCVYSPVAAELADGDARGAGGSYVAFIGNFTHAPNRDALEWLLSEIWPLVRARVASAELHIAGPDIPGWAAGREGEGVVVRGFVESVDAFYGQARMAVVPYRFGGGTKIKALDAMARGCPVVATTIGSEGLQVTPGVHLRVADDARGFADAVVELMLSPDHGRTLAEAARAHIERCFSWDVKVAALVEMLRAVGARKAEVRAPA